MENFELAIEFMGLRLTLAEVNVLVALEFMGSRTRAATVLKLSEDTIKSHVYRVLKKTKFKSCRRLFEKYHVVLDAMDVYVREN